MPVLRLSWLGPPRIEVDGHPIRLEMRKTLALLAYLSLSPQRPSRETLAALFWPEFDQQHSHTNLRRNLFSLARSLPPGMLETDRERVGLRRGAWLQVDVEDFRERLSSVKKHAHPLGAACPDCSSALVEAAGLYTGSFLEGFNLKDCPAFDDWQFYQRESLRIEAASVLEILAANDQSRGDWEKAIDHARSWVALDRVNEPAQQMLIQLYHQSGQRNMALRQYEMLVDLLREELGQAPDEKTRSLYQSLIAHSASGSAEVRSAAPGSAFRAVEPLLKTKLFIPPVRADRVVRPRLLDLLDAGAQRPLTLLSAPAGFGKTTLLAGWTMRTELPIAWFSVDEGDNDPARFVTYLIAALDSVLSADLSEQLQSFMQSYHPTIRPILIQLINHLAVVREPFVLILDDYQYIHSLDVHQALAFIIENMPACMHLVIATRSDPPLELARLRARDHLVEIRMGDLRFGPEETAGFLKQVMAVHLSKEDVTALEARTEGWIAGLQMAALAIRTIASQQNREVSTLDSEPAISQFVQAFSGTNRYILDYLGEEVLSRQPEETRRFLLQTAILERFSAPLCDAVTGSHNSRKILEALEKENLFVVPLDSERQWYRYHHLFADLLRYRLEETLSKHLDSESDWLCLKALHQRAAEWLEKNQLFGEAVHHFIAAENFDPAAALIEMQAKSMLFRTGQTYTLREWLAALPEDLFLRRPHLSVAKAWTLILRDQFAAALEQIERLQQGVQELQDAEADSVLGEIALVRGVLAELRSRDLATMRTQGLLAWEKIPRNDLTLRGLAAWLVGASYFFDGDMQPAEDYLFQAIQLCKEAGNIFITAVAVQELSLVRIEQGRVREAYHLLQQTLHEISPGGRHSHPSLAYLYYVMSQISLAWNEPEEAERQLKIGLDLVAQDIPGEVFIMTTSILPYVKLAQGKREEALRLAEECLQRVEAYPQPYLPTMIKADLIRFWIQVGDRNRIEAWLRSCGLTPADAIQRANEQEYTALARVLLWQGRLDEACKVLAGLHDLAQGQGRNGRLCSVLALQALALKQLGDIDAALKALETSLRLSQPEGTIRLYVEAGEPMEELLQFGAAREVWQQASLGSTVDRLLDAFQQ